MIFQPTRELGASEVLRQLSKPVMKLSSSAASIASLRMWL